MILNFVEDKSFESYEINIDMKSLYEEIQDFLKMVEGLGESKLDLNSHLYKKKVKPFIEKVGDTLYGRV